MPAILSRDEATTSSSLSSRPVVTKSGVRGCACAVSPILDPTEPVRARRQEAVAFYTLFCLQLPKIRLFRGLWTSTSWGLNA